MILTSLQIIGCELNPTFDPTDISPYYAHCAAQINETRVLLHGVVIEATDIYSPVLTGHVIHHRGPADDAHFL